MSALDAEAYHDHQIGWLAEAGAEMITALTLSYIEEAVGICVAARKRGVPVVISFTVETDGKLPSGISLAEAIEATDLATENYPAYYMINCAHPSHFWDAVTCGEAWTQRLGGLRANASKRSHEELEALGELDAGDPEELGQWVRRLTDTAPQFRILGGCCGTDEAHLEAICRSQQTNGEVKPHP